MNKTIAIFEAKKKSREEHKPFVVIHDPKTYIDVFEGKGYVVLDFDSFLSIFGVEFSGRIIYNTHKKREDVRYA